MKNIILDNLWLISVTVGLIGAILFFFDINTDLGLYILILSGALVVLDLFLKSKKKPTTS